MSAKDAALGAKGLTRQGSVMTLIAKIAQPVGGVMRLGSLLATSAKDVAQSASGRRQDVPLKTSVQCAQRVVMAMKQGWLAAKDVQRGGGQRKQVLHRGISVINVTADTVTRQG